MRDPDQNPDTYLSLEPGQATDPQNLTRALAVFAVRVQLVLSGKISNGICLRLPRTPPGMIMTIHFQHKLVMAIYFLHLTPFTICLPRQYRVKKITDVIQKRKKQSF